MCFVQEYEFSIPNCAITTDSYDGISASANYFLILDVVCASSTYRFSTYFKVRNPMPVCLCSSFFRVASPSFDRVTILFGSL